MLSIIECYWLTAIVGTTPKTVIQLRLQKSSSGNSIQCGLQLTAPAGCYLYKFCCTSLSSAWWHGHYYISNRNQGCSCTTKYHPTSAAHQWSTQQNFKLHLSTSSCNERSTGGSIYSYIYVYNKWITHIQPPQQLLPSALHSRVGSLWETLQTNPQPNKISFLLSRTDIKKLPTLLHPDPCTIVVHYHTLFLS